ncbi:hypothetical protein TWF281_005672 [Arthrobotrys megalospora]
MTCAHRHFIKQSIHKISTPKSPQLILLKNIQNSTKLPAEQSIKIAKGAYKTENSVGKEHGITSHSAYCRFNGIKNALKAEAQIEAAISGDTENTLATQPSPSRKRGRKAASPPKARGRKMKEEPEVPTDSKGSSINGDEENNFDEDNGEELLPSPSKKQKQKKAKKGAVKVEKVFESDESDWFE